MFGSVIALPKLPNPFPASSDFSKTPSVLSTLDMSPASFRSSNLGSIVFARVLSSLLWASNMVIIDFILFVFFVISALSSLSSDGSLS